MTWPLDKLTVINDALGLTGNNLVAVEDDGSDEFNVASAAYESAITYMIEGHDWGFGTIVEALHRNGTPSDPLFTDAYNKPPLLLHLIWARLDDQPVEYRILNNQIVLNASGEPPVDSSSTPGTVTIKYVKQPDITAVTPTFIMALRSFVMSGIYRGLHEDPDQADKMWMAGESFLQKARSRADQESPKRAFFNHRITAARRIRRPWPPVANEWGGTGNPG